ncbi:MAG: exo-beta-N-acetylmuramidase NamZ domain-containing protein, partial [Bacteroidota bacterium]
MKSAKYTKISLILLVTITCFLSFACEGSPQDKSEKEKEATEANENEQLEAENKRRAALKTGPEVLFEKHLDKLTGKSLAVVANHTSQFRNGTHLVDSLISKGIKVEKVFAPEHGFRGTADAGEAVESGKDAKTGLPIISLYGKNKKPNKAQMEGLDMVIFDIQDVGSRHYTYIGTMTYVMEACAEKGIPIMVLDRPNPNGWYVDG